MQKSRHTRTHIYKTKQEKKKAKDVVALTGDGCVRVLASSADAPMAKIAFKN
jgi:hypothetical protein